jgi:hypothetical protein
MRLQKVVLQISVLRQELMIGCIQVSAKSNKRLYVIECVANLHASAWKWDQPGSV